MLSDDLSSSENLSLFKRGCTLNPPPMHNNSYSSSYRLRTKVLLWILTVASGLFIAGIFLPMITLSKFVVVKSTFSVVSGVFELLGNGQIVLFIVVTCFSIVLPAMKILVLYKLLLSNLNDALPVRRLLHLMHEYGRWAMLDVLIVAVLVVTVKLGAIASVEVHLGLFVFGASALLIMLLTQQVVRLINQPREPHI